MAVTNTCVFCGKPISGDDLACQECCQQSENYENDPDPFGIEENKN
ncbi:hypothetical protein KA062_03055 [Patescibacteria group bacterium]|nr:hypothetical protein [Patescibacteria group bacterium]